ncbi:MAG: hypothetical protein KUG73_06075 [Pseudomonadales bacterium]|nr:hypothetical protein [Pseudomonadales bacterium]
MSSFLEWRPDFKLAPSRSAALFVSALHVISLLVVVWVMISYSSLVVVALCCVITVMLSWLASLASLGFFQKRNLRPNQFNKIDLLNRRRRICAVTQAPTGEWELHFADGSVQQCLLSGGSVVSRFAIFLSFKPIGSSRLVAPFLTRSLLIATDSVSGQTYRRLHVWLRWQRGELLGLADHGDRGA